MKIKCVSSCSEGLEAGIFHRWGRAASDGRVFSGLFRCWNYSDCEERAYSACRRIGASNGGNGKTPEWRPVSDGQAAEGLAAGVGWWCRRFSAQKTKKPYISLIHKAFVFLALSFPAPWGGRRGSNPRPSEPQSDALTD